MLTITRSPSHHPHSYTAGKKHTNLQVAHGAAPGQPGHTKGVVASLHKQRNGDT